MIAELSIWQWLILLAFGAVNALLGWQSGQRSAFRSVAKVMHMAAYNAVRDAREAKACGDQVGRRIADAEAKSLDAMASAIETEFGGDR